MLRSNLPHPIVKIVANAGCQTYLVGCPETRVALLVDPKVGRTGNLRDLLESYRLTLGAVLDTHTHADHLSASGEFLAAGNELWMSEHSACRRPRRSLKDGETVAVGCLRFEVCEVPGHTPDSLALIGHGMALVGDSLLVGSLARADFRGSHPARLFTSVKDRLMSLPDETLVFPGHGYRDILFTTIGKERESNPALQFPNGAAYAQELDALEGAGNTPAVDRTLEMNLEENPDLPVTPQNVATCCAAGTAGSSALAVPEVTPEAIAKEHEALAATKAWIDVRDPHEFEHAHIPGTRNLPLSELGFHSEVLRGRGDLVFSCRSGVRSITAARTLQHLGLIPSARSVEGGIRRWQKLELPTTPTGRKVS